MSTTLYIGQYKIINSLGIIEIYFGNTLLSFLIYILWAEVKYVWYFYID